MVAGVTSAAGQNARGAGSEVGVYGRGHWRPFYDEETRTWHLESDAANPIWTRYSYQILGE